MSELNNPLLTNSGYLRINDIEFDIPPERIAIVKRDFSNQVSTIRSQTSTVIKTGRQIISFVVELHFGTGYNAATGIEKNITSWINQQLAPLIIQVRKCPFVSIENEKIRKEILGLDPSYNERTIAAVVKDIEVTSSARSSENLKASITMDYFNYQPFTPDFKYKEALSSGAIVPSTLPGKYFTDFYREGTLDDKGRYVNSLYSTKNTSLTLIYKQYYRLSLEEQGLQRFIEETSIESEFSLDTVKTAYNTKANEWQFLTPKDKSVAQSLEALKQLGWEEEKEPFAPENNIKLLYRYKKFEIDGNISLTSDRLIVESASAGLSTVTPSITLQGHAAPTTQFLGCSDGRLTLQFFANAHLLNEKPVGTSRELSRLQEILHYANQNAINYHRETFNDGVFIRHPLAKLLKYKKYNKDKKSIRVFNPVTGQVDVEDINEYLFCHSEDISSETVPGHPFCSRLTVSFIENYISDGSEPLSKQGQGISSYEAGKNMVKKLAERFGITKQGGIFAITDRPIAVTQEESSLAEKLLRYMNTVAKLKDIKINDEVIGQGDKFQNISSMLDSPLISTRQVKLRESLVVSGLSEERYRTPTRNYEPVLCFETFHELVDDLLVMIENSETQRYSDYDSDISVIRLDDAVPIESAYPDMMLPSSFLQPDDAWYNISDQRNNSGDLVKFSMKSFDARYKAGLKSAEQFGANLPSELKDSNYVPAKWYPAPSANAASKYPGGVKEIEDVELGTPFIQNVLEPNEQAYAARRAVKNLMYNTYSMRRAMPTMKIYFREDLQINEDPTFATNKFWRNFSDVYDVNAIIDIRVAKSDDNPVDMMVIRITNSRKDLMSKYFEVINKDAEKTVADLKAKRQEKRSLKPEESKNNAAFNQRDDAKVIREGTRIELRLGYENNPNDLSVEFSGRIMSASGTDIIEIVCQGNGVELIQETKGVAGSRQSDFSFKGETGQVITKLLAISPEVGSFGALRTTTSLGQFALYEGFGGRSGLENIFAPPVYNTFARVGQSAFTLGGWAGIAVRAALFIPGVNIPAAKIVAVATLAGLAVDAYRAVRTYIVGCPFTVYEQTIWETLQELTMRHPGTICSVVPFGNRSTIFFGYPDQLYFYRPPSYQEKIKFKGISKGKNLLFTNSTTRRDLIKNNSGFLGRIGVNSETVTREQVDDFRNSSEGRIAEDAMKPFINYHLISSEHDIVINDMTTSSDDVFNAIEIVYPESSSDGNFDGSKGFSDYSNTDTILADDDLIRPFIKKQTLVFHNAHKDPVLDMPERYAVSNLVRSLENAYKGKIIILGRPGIKPHDIVFLEDSYSKISGPIKVGAVTQVFSYKTGWITEIHPKLIVAPMGSTLLDNIYGMKRTAKALYYRDWQIFQNGLINPATRSDIFNTGKTIKSLPVGARSLGEAAFNLTAGIASVDAGRKAFEYAKGLKDAGTLTRIGSFASKAFILPGTAFALDLAISKYISWSKTRQPITFMPVTRGSSSWVMGLHGFKTNTETDAIRKVASNVIGVTKELIDDYFNGP